MAQIEIDFADIDAILERIGTGQQHLIPILTAVQEKYNYLPETALKRICEKSDITAAMITGVASFYSFFRLRPAGRHLVKVCVGTACHIKGAAGIKNAVLRCLNVPDGDDTDENGVFTVVEVACLGCCTLAPVVQIDEVTYGHLTTGTVSDMLDDFLALQQERQGNKNNNRPLSEPSGITGEIRIGLGSCCIAGGSLKVKKAFEREIKNYSLPVRVKNVGCVGMCHRTPLVEVIDGDGRSFRYTKVEPERVPEIVRNHFRPDSLLARICTAASGMLDKLLAGGSMPSLKRYELDARDPQVRAFLDKQVHIATDSYGTADPVDIDEYLAHHGYQALTTVLTDQSPESVIDSVRCSGLRGRGGAGFPAWRKWQMVAESGCREKFVIMNGDEGDPGAFMDRMLLESFPYRILEGITIAAYAVGASEAVLYIRKEYSLALARVREAIKVAEKRGYLGNAILSSGFSLKVRIMEGAGAFICGEETALLESIEGRRGIPRQRPPYPAMCGLRGAPTLINNVETYACVPWIIRQSAQKFASLGTEKSRGTKVFSLTGKINRGGLVEVPMGMSIREIVEEIGGGIQDGRAFKAVQIGGPSGGCVPASMGDTVVDYEALAEIGAIMGSGGLVVLDDTDCMVDVARYFLQFTQEQSCGKCTFCRIGTRRMLDILTAICEGRGRNEDLVELEQLAQITQKGSLCGLGRTAPNPVLSTLRYFRDEYEAHLNGFCPAGRCQELIRYFITTDCIGCTRCAQVCPVEAISFNPYQRQVIDRDLCIRCDMCRQVCPSGAVKISKN